MASDRSIRRYRRWYAGLLRLYPRPFRQRFAEPMTQTFTDLARERSQAAADARGSGLIGFVAWSFMETTVAIVRENVRHMLVQTNVIVRWVLITAAALAIPALAMLLNVGVPDPGSGTEGVNWGPMDFAVMGTLVLGSGLLYEYASLRRANVMHRAAVAIAVLAGLGLVWVNLAVGFMDVEDANLLYALVLFVALIGAAVGRFEPRHAAVAMFAAAGVQAVIAVIGLVAGLGPTLAADAFWIAGWVASGLLFRQASLTSAPTD